MTLTRTRLELRLAGAAVTLGIFSVGCGALAPKSTTSTTLPAGELAQAEGDNSAGSGDSSNGNGDGASGTNTDCKLTTSTSTSTSSDAANYANTAGPVIQQRCASCHATQAPLLTTPAQAKAASAAIVASVTAGRMPPGNPLSALELAKIQSWSDSGFAALALTETVPTYEGTIKAIIDTKCAWCHSATAAPGDRHSPYLTTYAQVKNKSGDIREEMNGGDMPPGNVSPQLDPGDTQLFADWIAGGRLEGVPPAAIDLNSPVYYLDSIKTLVDRQCVGCHKPGVQAPDLSTYETLIVWAAAAQADINAGTMPPSAPLSANGKDGFAAWVTGGKLKDASSTPVPTPTPPPPIDVAQGVYYIDAIKTLLDSQCVSCHKPGVQPPDLSTYTTAVASAALAMADINAGTMPPGAPLSTNHKTAFTAWVDGGTLYDAGGSTPPVDVPSEATDTRSSGASGSDTGTGTGTGTGDASGSKACPP